MGESLFCFTKCTFRSFIPAKQKAIFLHDSPRRMFLFCARIIKIKSWPVSCAKRRIGCGQRRLTFACPGLGTARCAHIVYFHLLTIQTPLKRPTHGCSHFSQKEKTIPAPPQSTFSHLFSSICIIVIILNLPVLFGPWAWRHEYSILGQLQTNTTVCETLCFEWRTSVRSPCWLAEGKTCMQGKHIDYIM